MTVEPMSAVASAGIPEKLRIEFLFLDLTTCTRCLGADRGLETALDVVRDVLDAAGVEVEVDKVLVASEEQARALRFVSSPTIRVDGRDVALELRESSCGSEACTDGCGDHIACRVWVYRGAEYTEPPVAMIVDAILKRVYGDAPQGAAPSRRATSCPRTWLASTPERPPAAASAAVSRPSRRPAARPRPRRTAAAPNTRRDAGAGERPASRRAARRSRGMG